MLYLSYLPSPKAKWKALLSLSVLGIREKRGLENRTKRQGSNFLIFVLALA
jgi:hypothetical protein